MEARVYFPIGKSAVDPDFQENRRHLDDFVDSLREIVNTPGFGVSRLTVIGAASPDGSRKRNIELAGQRARALADYISTRTGFPADKIDIVNRGEDWSGLRVLIESSEMSCKTDMLRLIERYSAQGDTLRLKHAVQYYADSKPWLWMYERFFPQLRSGVSCDPEIIPVAADTTCRSGGAERPSSETLIPEVPADPPVVTQMAVESLVPADRPVRGLHPVFALKTNLVLWAGVTPEFDISTFMPNLAAELYFARRWSVEGSYVYSDWKYFKGDKLWAVSAFSVEPRFWFRRDGQFRGFYVGVYGQYGEFDNQRDRHAGGGQRTGTFFSAGASIGYAQALSRHWYIEIGIKGGYFRADTDVYDIELPHHYFNHNLTEGKFSPGLRLNVMYRFGQGSGHRDNRSGK